MRRPALRHNQMARRALRRLASLGAPAWRHADGSDAVKFHLLKGRAGQGGARHARARV
ncbi:hypothetical protein [Xanthomonas oryzae]|uniref:hypothetical protein n=1 Tax=Xanthomonas oryzae TaxID=347 RepID=UPI0013EF681F|nr:hypothetical protein [Xanthomonas oryzae]UNE63331.1 hypothetical protein MML47_03335 [Xanthomonas oryzae]